MSDIRTSELVINKLSKQQYDTIQNPSDTELYLVPEDEEHKPICYPTTADNVCATSMDLKSSVSDNGLKLTEVGFVYSDSNQSPTVSDTKVICNLGVGRIEKSLSGLSGNTPYYIRSYGINQCGTSYGDLLTQTTAFLPDEYQAVEYIQSSGTQYINTGVKPDFETEWYVDYMFLHNNQNQIGASGPAISGDTRFVIANLSDGLYIGMGSGVQTTIQCTNVRKSITLQPFNHGFIVDDVLYSHGGNTPAINYNIYIFARNTGGNISNVSTGRLYNSKISINNGTQLVRDFYPCYRKSDNEPGLYDVVNDTFYTNGGSGSFVIGPDVN